MGSVKVLAKTLGVLVVGVLSVLGVQRLVRRFYNNLGRNYVRIDRDELDG